MQPGHDNTPPTPPMQGTAPSEPAYTLAPLPPSFARPASDGRLDPDLVIEHDMACFGCGYNLRTRRIRDACPECGAPVRHSFTEPGPATHERMYGSNTAANVSLTMGIIALALGLNTMGVAGVIFGPIGIGFYYKYQSDSRRGIANPSPRTQRIAKAGLITSWIGLGLCGALLAILAALAFL
ncbi:MAG: DUF4190 domain-containing protein [Phycisphaerales bacterium JB063]